jgi:hypothetical protein
VPRIEVTLAKRGQNGGVSGSVVILKASHKGKIVMVKVLTPLGFSSEVASYGY